MTKTKSKKKEQGSTKDTSSNDETATPGHKEHWKNDPDDHDYPAAGDYLSLSLDESSCASVVAWLRVAPIKHYKAKDILRASGLSLLPMDNVHVAEDLEKVGKGEKLSPVLLVRGTMEFAIPLVIADGYHRVCASYHIDENADIPCRMTGLD